MTPPQPNPGCFSEQTLADLEDPRGQQERDLCPLPGGAAGVGGARGCAAVNRDLASVFTGVRSGRSWRLGVPRALTPTPTRACKQGLHDTC